MTYEIPNGVGTAVRTILKEAATQKWTLEKGSNHYKLRSPSRNKSVVFSYGAGNSSEHMILKDLKNSGEFTWPPPQREKVMSLPGYTVASPLPPVAKSKNLRQFILNYLRDSESAMSTADVTSAVTAAGFDRPDSAVKALSTMRTRKEVVVAGWRRPTKGGVYAMWTIAGRCADVPNPNKPPTKRTGPPTPTQVVERVNSFRPRPSVEPAKLSNNDALITRLQIDLDALNQRDEALAQQIALRNEERELLAQQQAELRTAIAVTQRYRA